MAIQQFHPDKMSAYETLDLAMVAAHEIFMRVRELEGAKSDPALITNTQALVNLLCFYHEKLEAPAPSAKCN